MGRVIVVLLLAVALIGGATMYYLQVYHYYERPVVAEIDVATPEGGQVAIPATDIEAIDATSSPLRFRACFDTPLSPTDAARFVPYEGAEPLNAPFWFGCFDAAEAGVLLSVGEARAVLGAKNVAYGVDRVVAFLPGGRGVVWHQLNNCGRKAYDGTPVGEACPPRED